MSSANPDYEIIDPAESYEQVISAQNAGHKIEICTINDKGAAVAWGPPTQPIKNFPVNRYRILIEPIQGVQVDALMS